MAANDFFKATSDLRNYVPDIGISTNILTLEYCFREPENKIRNLIGQATYNQLKDHYNGDNNDAILLEGIKYMQGSLANLAGLNYFIMDAGDRNENKKLFKYQEDQQSSLYLNNAHGDIGQLLVHLDANAATYTEWVNTNLYETRQAQIIKTHTEFGKYYYIDESAYYFWKLVFIMKEISNDKIFPLTGDFNDLDAESDAAIINKAKQALAYLTVAMSLRRFDFIEIPKTIRNNVSDEKSRTIRTGYGEDSAVSRISGEIETKGIMYLQSLSRMMEKKNTGELTEPEDIHQDDDNFYLQT